MPGGIQEWLNESNQPGVSMSHTKVTSDLTAAVPLHGRDSAV